MAWDALYSYSFVTPAIQAARFLFLTSALAMAASEFFFAQARLGAQALSASAGAMSATSDPHSGGSYSWQIHYRQRVDRNLAWSLTWLNEGHVPGHHRDGFAGQIWGVLPLFDDRLNLAAGIGLYSFFDTKKISDSNGGLDESLNVHNIAAIYSVSATWRVSRRWFLLATVNRVASTGGMNMNSLTYTVGPGYWLGWSRSREVAADAWHPRWRNEVTVFAGGAVVNIHGGQNTFATQIEYRRALSARVDWSVAYLNEGSDRDLKRSGAVSQIWFAGRFFSERVQVAFGAGVYWTFGSMNESEDWQTLSAIVSPGIAWHFTERWLVRLTWNRVISSYHRDTDNFLLGLGYAWGG